VAKTKSDAKTKSGKDQATTFTTAQAAEELGVSVGWVRARIAGGKIKPARSSNKRSARYRLSEADLAELRADAAEDPTAGGQAALAVVSRLEAERANLLAQVAWERAIAQEQQKALEAELARTQALTTELEMQRARVEALKALSAWDRVLGRHKSI